MQADSFLLMLLSFIISFGKINRSAVGAAIVSLPRLIFFIARLALMSFMF